MGLANNRQHEQLPNSSSEIQEYLNFEAFLIYLTLIKEIKVDHLMFACKTWIINNRFSSMPKNEKEKALIRKKLFYALRNNYENKQELAELLLPLDSIEEKIHNHEKFPQELKSRALIFVNLMRVLFIS